MAALSVAELVLRRDLQRAVEEWALGLRLAKESEDLRAIAQQMEMVGREAQQPAKPPTAATNDSGWPELERANQRLSRLLPGGKR